MGFKTFTFFSNLIRKNPNFLLLTLPNTKFIHVKKCVLDIINEEDQLEFFAKEHNRAHFPNLEQMLNPCN